MAMPIQAAPIDRSNRAITMQAARVDDSGAVPRSSPRQALSGPPRSAEPAQRGGLIPGRLFDSRPIQALARAPIRSNKERNHGNANSGGPDQSVKPQVWLSQHHGA